MPVVPKQKKARPSKENKLKARKSKKKVCNR
jgi:hypothetical protein